jgi:hypothetical protein
VHLQAVVQSQRVAALETPDGPSDVRDDVAGFPGHDFVYALQRRVVCDGVGYDLMMKEMLGRVLSISTTALWK